MRNSVSGIPTFPSRSQRLSNGGDGNCRPVGKALRLLSSLFALSGSIALASGAQLSWSDNSINENGFKVERSADGQAWLEIGTTAADVASYTDDTVVAGVSYSYRVNAFNEFGFSGYTNVATYYRNLAPTISAVGNLDLAENEASEAIAFTIGDQETGVSELSVNFASSNTALFDVSSAVFAGTGADRTLTLTPLANQFGSALITLTVDDGEDIAIAQFSVVVEQFVPPSIDLVLSFANGAARAGESFGASIASADLSLFESVVYTLDGVTVGSSFASPFAVSITPAIEGSQTLRAVARVINREKTSESVSALVVGPAPTEQDIVDNMRTRSIDDASLNGSTSYDLSTDTFTLKNDAGEIFGTADSHHYSYLMVSGDLVLTVELQELAESSSLSVAGIMLRSALYGKSVQSALLVGAEGRVELRERSVRSGETSVETLANGTAGYSKLRISRTGTSLEFYASVDGQNWILLTTRASSVTDECFAGLALAAGPSGGVATAVFKKLELQGVTRVWTEDATAPGVPSGLIISSVE